MRAAAAIWLLTAGVAHATEPPPPSTTDGTLAADNLDAQVDALERRLARAPIDDDDLTTLIELHRRRAQYFGAPAEWERAAALCDRLVRAAPRAWRAHLERAESQASLHRFDAALVELTAAEKMGGGGARAERMRASIAAATGHTADALAIWRRQAQVAPDLETLGGLAVTLGLDGRVAEAEQAFMRAREAYRDVSPFPVAWLEFQEGLLEERAGRPAAARAAYRAAHLRLPRYAAAAAHLAGLLDEAAAHALLQPLVATGDPEYAGQLAVLARKLGHSDEAARLTAQAAGDYRALVARHPEAYGAHAAHFWLGAGGDAARALPLAEAEVRARPTREAFMLLIDAALAAGKSERACRAAERSLAQPSPTAALHLLAARAFERCGRRGDAQAQIEAAAK